MTEPHPLPDLHTVFGFGVAGNFAGHLEQAGEAADFVGIGSAEHEAPKGIFPWFVPGAAAADARDQLEPTEPGGVPPFLGTFPLSSTEIVLPAGDGLNLQIEPEVGLLARVTYGDDEDGAVVSLQPEAIARLQRLLDPPPGREEDQPQEELGRGRARGSRRCWSPSTTSRPMARRRPSGWPASCAATASVHAYGIDSALPDYSYYGDQLLDWIVDRLANQTGSADTPLEPVGAYLRAAGNPPVVLIGIGATRYTPLGESTFLQVGDESIVVVYDGAESSAEDVAAAVTAGTEDELPVASVLRQRVVAG